MRLIKFRRMMDRNIKCDEVGIMVWEEEVVEAVAEEEGAEVEAVVVGEGAEVGEEDILDRFFIIHFLNDKFIGIHTMAYKLKKGN